MKKGNLYTGTYYTWIGNTCVETLFSFILLEDVKEFQYGGIVEVLRVCIDPRTKEVIENAILPCLIHWLCDKSNDFFEEYERCLNEIMENDIMES